MASNGFPLWYTESLNTTMVWNEGINSCLLTKTDGSTFVFRKDTQYALTMKGVKRYYKVTGFLPATCDESQGPKPGGPPDKPGGPAGLYFLEWNGCEWVDQDELFDYSTMTCMPGGIGRRGFIVDWNSVEPWST